MTYQAKVIAGGKIVIPADIRRELGIKDGDTLVIDRDVSGATVLRTYAQVVAEVQETLRTLREPNQTTHSVVDELVAERRESARREADKFDCWIAERA